ncbi:MAG: metal ABC transporter substrate-binding protein [Oscillospiraceae bacterium]|jgi:zinc transport system substrate-binding protein|nr:metal ABC transporter substrate-binding protein [Oscillospiraceae bacterium]
MRRLLIILSSAIVLTSCNIGFDGGESGGGRLKVVATIFPVFDFTRAVAGGAADVTMLIRPGSSVHSYDPSVSDIKRINECDAFVCVGGESEAWVDKLDLNGKTAIRLMDYFSPLEDGDGNYDEHIWTDPYNAGVCLTAIAGAMAEIDPENAGVYRNNEKNYGEGLKTLEADIADIVKTAKRDKIVVADRFALRYFTERYGLEYEAAFNACHDQSDASAATVARLIKTVKAEGIPYIYYAELSNNKVAAAVSRETGAQTLLFHSCQNVTGEEFERGETYLSLMRQNAENLKKGLN